MFSNFPKIWYSNICPAVVTCNCWMHAERKQFEISSKREHYSQKYILMLKLIRKDIPLTFEFTRKCQPTLETLYTYFTWRVSTTLYTLYTDFNETMGERGYNLLIRTDTIKFLHKNCNPIWHRKYRKLKLNERQLLYLELNLLEMLHTKKYISIKYIYIGKQRSVHIMYR